MTQNFRFVDLFCGGGGSITGAISALKNAGMPYEGRGFNHWDIAIRTIKANHPEIVPDFERACAPIESVLPDEIFTDEPLIIKYYGSETTAQNTHKPLDTITTKDRFGLIQGRILTMPDDKQYKLDITHRMLTAAELARATSFPDGYIFCGGDTAAKKQIGNAVPPVLAEALYSAILAA